MNISCEKYKFSGDRKILGLGFFFFGGGGDLQTIAGKCSESQDSIYGFGIKKCYDKGVWNAVILFEILSFIPYIL